jgi:hypothetical protein
MLYDDFINELLNWQGIFDGFIQSPGAYKEYYRLISENIKDLDTLRYCLESHANNEKQFFPKPFEMKAYSDEFKKIMSQKLYDSPFYREILEMKDLLKTQNEAVIYYRDDAVKVETMKKIIIENEKQLKDLEKKRANILKIKGYLNA